MSNRGREAHRPPIKYTGGLESPFTVLTEPAKLLRRSAKKVSLFQLSVSIPVTAGEMNALTEPPTNSMQRTALRAAADAER